MTDVNLSNIPDDEFDTVRGVLCNDDSCQQHTPRGSYPCPVPESKQYVDTDDPYNGWRRIEGNQSTDA